MDVLCGEDILELPASPAEHGLLARVFDARSAVQ